MMLEVIRFEYNSTYWIDQGNFLRTNWTYRNCI